MQSHARVVPLHIPHPQLEARHRVHSLLHHLVEWCKCPQEDLSRGIGEYSLSCWPPLHLLLCVCGGGGGE